MARNFSTRLDIDNADPTNFPDGRIRDSSSPAANDGTAIVEAVLGDLHQFFLKLLRDASITPNGNADTDSVNQLLEALIAKVRTITADVNNAGVVELATLLEVQAGTNTLNAVTPATLAGLTATSSRRGLIELSLNSEVTAGTNTQTSISPANLRSQIASFSQVNTGTSTTALLTPGRLNNASLAVLNATSFVMRVATFDIGVWNMDTTNVVNINHNLGADWENVVQIQALIFDDNEASLVPLSDGGSAGVLPTQIRLARDASGVFDSPAYDSTTVTNRGRVSIHYLDLNV